MIYIHNTLEINNIKYRYVNININSLKLYLLKHDLMKSFEFIIKEHKENYDYNELFKDHRKNRKLTKFNPTSRAWENNPTSRVGQKMVDFQMWRSFSPLLLVKSRKYEDVVGSLLPTL